MSFEPSSPSTDITNTDPFEYVAYSDIIEGSIYYEKEVSTPTQLFLQLSLNFLDGNKPYYKVSSSPRCFSTKIYWCFQSVPITRRLQISK